MSKISKKSIQDFLQSFITVCFFIFSIEVEKVILNEVKWKH
jgi:hypothetical protein